MERNLRIENPCAYSSTEIAYGVAAGSAGLGTKWVVNPWLAKQLGFVQKGGGSFRSWLASSHSWVDFALRVAALCWIVFLSVIVAPQVEENLFRGEFWIEAGDQDKEPLLQTSARVLSNATLFSLAHLTQYSWALGVGNLLPFVSHAIGGVVYATLRETTGNTHSSKVAHTTNNFLAFLSRL